MGDCEAKSPILKKKRELKDWNKAGVCHSDRGLAWQADVPGLRSRAQGSRGHSTKGLERTRATPLLS